MTENNIYTPLKVLNESFGYESFRPLQLDIINNILSHNDTLAILPTGGGKSICYQIPALMLDGLTVVVSPLISLMMDQIEKLKSLNISAEYLNSTQSSAEQKSVMQKISTNTLKMLYVAPETLVKPSVLKLLEKINMSLLAIDEAHCISEWGHEFRPEYRKLAEIKTKLDVPVLALTATATELVRTDICNQLKFKSTKSNTYISSFDRKNLNIDVRCVHNDDKLRNTLRVIKNHPNQSGIIYCFSRKGTDTLAEELKDRGISAMSYHAGMTTELRTVVQNKFISGDVDIIVATIAFGMGIDKPDVRYVIHYDLPKDVESYYQQIGRAGRDGDKSDCTLLYSHSDIHKIEWIIDQSKIKSERIRLRKSLDVMMDYVEYNHCRRKFILNYFGETYKHAHCEKMCDNCR